MKSSMSRARSLPVLARLCIVAGLIAGAAAATAAPAGFTVTQKEQQQVRIGMTQDEVRAALGTPARNIHFQQTDRTTWTYQRAEIELVFDVEFGADGKVVAAAERYVPFD